jgi:Kef-type K+ transport system membrane component KefB
MQIFIEIGLIIFIATAVSVIMRLLKQPLIVGYILSGIIIGPYLLNLTQSTESIELFSRLGVAILLFIVGLNLRPDIIRQVGRPSFLIGLGQMALTTLLGFLLMRVLGFDSIISLYGAVALAFSSTIVAMKFISDKGDFGKLYGKISVGFLLVQDVVAAAIILIVSIIGSTSLILEGTLFFTFWLLLKGIFFFLALYLISRYLLPRISSFLASSPELLFIFSIAWGLGLSAVFYLFGFSLEIGALAAGVALSSSAFSQEISSRMKPLRDFFILLFFILLGSQILLSNLGQVILPAVVLSVFVLILKPLIVILLMNLLGYKNRTGFKTGLAVSQISEFSLILLALGLSFGKVNREALSLITLVGVFTISGSAYFILHTERLYEFARRLLSFLEFCRPSKTEKEEEGEQAEIIIFGYDRVGYDFVRVAQKNKSKYLVVDFDPKAIARMERNNIPYCFGDAEDVDFLTDIGTTRARAIVSTIPDFKTNLNLVSFYRHHNRNGIIILISHNIQETQELYRLGASFVVMPHYLGAKQAARMLEIHGLQAKEFERERRQHLLELEHRLKLTGE